VKPLYWQRRRLRRNPSEDVHVESVYEEIDAATTQLADAFASKDAAKRATYAVSAAMYAGAAVAHAEGAGDRGLHIEAMAMAKQIRNAAPDLMPQKPVKNPRKPPGRKAQAAIRAFVRSK
jgi:hypothetical protein